MMQMATHRMHYVDAATTNILSPDKLLVKEIKSMLRHIESQLPSIIHLCISLDNTLHFYRYLKTQDRTQQLHTNEISDKYIGITYDETQVEMITEKQYLTCLHANGQFCKVGMAFQALINPPHS